MSWWVLEAKYRDTELKILEMGGSSHVLPRMALDLYKRYSACAFFVWKIGVEGFY
jgi:hypothetical protein